MSHVGNASLPIHDGQPSSVEALEALPPAEVLRCNYDLSKFPFITNFQLRSMLFKYGCLRTNLVEAV